MPRSGDSPENNAQVEENDKTVTPMANTHKGRRPLGLEWRSSVWFITLVVGIAITTDILIYSLIVPIIPFRLQGLGYEGVSSLVGWLLFAYSASLVIFTPPIAYLTEKYKNRKIPLLLGQVALIGSQVMLMEAPAFWVMALARIVQGISACVIWVVGLALICDSVPEKIVGKQLGLAMMGMSLGALIGPPVAGGLDKRFGFHGPFIFGIIVTVIELIGRLLIIERKEAARWDTSSTSLVGQDESSREKTYGSVRGEMQEEQPNRGQEHSVAHENGEGTAEVPIGVPFRAPTANEAQQHKKEEEPVISIPQLLLKLARSSRALSAIFVTLSYGVMIISLEPVLPLYLQATFGFDASKVGLVYIAAVVPSFVSSPVSGWYADQGGTIVSTLVCLVGSLPFWCLLIIRSNLAYFLVMFTFLNLFFTGIISPVTAELASVTRSLESVGYGHVYGAFNIAYGIGSAIGPVIGGQLYDHIASSRGWLALCLFNAGLVAVNVTVVVGWFGETTIVRRLASEFRRRRSAQKDTNENQASA
ncbi:MFS general substrate transporter [Trametes punicea]|nr:MFS general substrate transporter [Trametes punicea]